MGRARGRAGVEQNLFVKFLVDHWSTGGRGHRSSKGRRSVFRPLVDRWPRASGLSRPVVETNFSIFCRSLLDRWPRQSVEQGSSKKIGEYLVNHGLTDGRADQSSSCRAEVLELFDRPLVDRWGPPSVEQGSSKSLGDSWSTIASPRPRASVDRGRAFLRRGSCRWLADKCCQLGSMCFALCCLL